MSLHVVLLMVGTGKPKPFAALFSISGYIETFPTNVQEQYLESLKAIGIDPLQHDIRFVEDNWESPTLGAWGLGWEVWFDGMEITNLPIFNNVAALTVIR